MFFKKKTTEPSDQFAVYQKREAPRYGAPQVSLTAGITIEGFEGEGQLGNISTSGCSMMSATYVALTPNKVYQVKIIPALDVKTEPFSLSLRVNWVKSSETLFQAGFAMEGNSGSPQLERYVDQLRSRGIMPDYGNMAK